MDMVGSGLRCIQKWKGRGVRLDNEGGGGGGEGGRGGDDNVMAEEYSPVRYEV